MTPTGKSFRFVRACERARRGEAAWASERRFDPVPRAVRGKLWRAAAAEPCRLSCCPVVRLFFPLSDCPVVFSPPREQKHSSVILLLQGSAMSIVRMRNRLPVMRAFSGESLRQMRFDDLFFWCSHHPLSRNQGSDSDVQGSAPPLVLPVAPSALCCAVVCFLDFSLPGRLF